MTNRIYVSYLDCCLIYLTSHAESLTQLIIFVACVFESPHPLEVLFFMGHALVKLSLNLTILIASALKFLV